LTVPRILELCFTQTVLLVKLLLVLRLVEADLPHLRALLRVSIKEGLKSLSMVLISLVSLTEEIASLRWLLRL
jgi:hypothetical protein